MSADLRIMILGKSDVGKTATANTILCRNAFQAGAQSDTLTCEKQDAVVSGRNISIIDTPGLLDAQMYKHFPDELKRDIDKCLEISAPGPHVFLLVIRLGRFTDEEKNTVRWIEENFGEDVKRFTMVLFTGADHLNKPLEDFLQEHHELQKLVADFEGRYHAFSNVENNDQTQVRELLEKINHSIVETNQGYYTTEMFKKTRRKTFMIACLKIIGVLTLTYVLYKKGRFWQRVTHICNSAVRI